MREPAVQRSPLREKTPNRAESMAASRSASAKTTQGDLPPSSMDRPLRLAAALRKMVWPVVVSPVKEIRDRKSTRELQSQSNLVCRLLLEKKKQNKTACRSVQ